MSGYAQVSRHGSCPLKDLCNREMEPRGVGWHRGTLEAVLLALLTPPVKNGTRSRAETGLSELDWEGLGNSSSKHIPRIYHHPDGLDVEIQVTSQPQQVCPLLTSTGLDDYPREQYRGLTPTCGPTFPFVFKAPVGPHPESKHCCVIEVGAEN